jgi:hypothetical protein
MAFTPHEAPMREQAQPLASIDALGSLLLAGVFLMVVVGRFLGDD